METVFINNLRCKLGQKKDGVEMGGDHLLNIFDNNQYKIQNFNFNDYNDYAIAYDYISKLNGFCINLGGDHSVGSVTVQSQLDKYQDDLLVIWIDAHADVNTWNSSITQNIHGMPVAPLLGLMNHWWVSSSDVIHHKLSPTNLVYIGIRDLDPSEIQVIDKQNIIFSKKYSSNIENWIKSHPAGKIHISLDIDGLDPKIMPSTGTTSSEGLDYDELIKIINISKNRLVSFDLVELNPLIGNVLEVNHTINNCKLILEIIKNIAIEK
jgi:arginase